MTKQFFKQYLLIFALSDTEHNLRIEKIAQMITSDHVSIDEQDQSKLKKYYDFAVQNYSLESSMAKELVHEAFLYLKLKDGGDIDPLTKGDEFGAGFS
jgi:hypothetical protein